MNNQNLHKSWSIENAASFAQGMKEAHPHLFGLASSSSATLQVPTPVPVKATHARDLSKDEYARQIAKLLRR